MPVQASKRRAAPGSKTRRDVVRRRACSIDRALRTGDLRGARHARSELRPNQVQELTKVPRLNPADDVERTGVASRRRRPFRVLMQVQAAAEEGCSELGWLPFLNDDDGAPDRARFSDSESQRHPLGRTGALRRCWRGHATVGPVHAVGGEGVQAENALCLVPAASAVELHKAAVRRPWPNIHCSSVARPARKSPPAPAVFGNHGGPVPRVTLT